MLTGKIALVTGSTSGIGLGIAQAFAEQNADVVVNARTQTPETDALVEQLNGLGTGRVIFAAADLLQQTEIEAMMAKVKSDLGPVDILVNNAGMQHVAPIEGFAPDKWDMVLSLNLNAAFHTMRLALADMKEKDWGRIINVASAHGQVASVNKSAYVASKHGLIGLTKVCALETAESGITANSICPGWVRTPLVEDQIVARAEKSGRSIDEEARDLLSEKQPSKQFATPDQLGAAAVFLCSDAASQMTGSTLTMDGGWTAV
ncbi:3-hydroxybutyrate dehydrogenase [Terasakiella sp.]|uniref:3-hydroxybutyrate dehydrogenase n=1 Tax=Terasakiella sp. TaxID=2034861 RepID=UPI003AA8FAAD